MVGYSTVMSAVAAIKKAGSLDQDKLIAAASGLKVLTPFGEVEYRPIDHQSTMGAYVGRLGVKDGKGVHEGMALRRRQGRAAERCGSEEDEAGQLTPTFAPHSLMLLSPDRGRGGERGLHELSIPPLLASPPSGGEGFEGEFKSGLLS